MTTERAHTLASLAELEQCSKTHIHQHGDQSEALARIAAKNHRIGALPVNPSGGLKAKGHPIAATGVSMHALVAAQFQGSAGAIRVPGAAVGAVFNMGGLAVANYVSILEPPR